MRRRECEREREREIAGRFSPCILLLYSPLIFIDVFIENNHDNVVLSINSRLSFPNSQDVIVPICHAITRYLTPLSNCRTDTHTGKVEIVYRQSAGWAVSREEGAKRALRKLSS